MASFDGTILLVTCPLIGGIFKSMSKSVSRQLQIVLQQVKTSLLYNIMMPNERNICAPPSPDSFRAGLQGHQCSTPKRRGSEDSDNEGKDNDVDGGSKSVTLTETMTIFLQENR